MWVRVFLSTILPFYQMEQHNESQIKAENDKKHYINI